MPAEYRIILIIAVAVAIYVGFEIMRGYKKAGIGSITGDGFKAKLGKYIFGLPNKSNEIENVECEVTKNDFVLLTKYMSKEIYRIPRDSVNDIYIEDKSQVHQRLSALGLLATGPFALAFPLKKERNKYCLIIDWEKDHRRYHTVFEVEGKEKVRTLNEAANQMKKFLKPKKITLKEDERKCPYCAEIIKKEAKICRFCRSNLESD